MKQQRAQDFVNVENIVDDVLISKDGYVFGYIYVRGRNIALLKEEEKRVHYDGLTTAMEAIQGEWQLISIPRPVNVIGMLDELFKLRKKTSSDPKLRLIDGELSAINELALNGVKEPVIVLKIWEKASKSAISVLKKRLSVIKSILEAHRTVAELLTTKEITYLCKNFADLTVYNSNDDMDKDEIPVMPDKKKAKQESQGNTALLNLITPMSGFQFGVNKLTVGNVVGRVYGAIRYPSELKYDWLVPVMNNTNAITSVYFNNTLKGELAEALSKSITSNLREATDERDARRSKQLIKQATDADELLSEIDEKQSSVGFATILTMPFSQNEEDFEDICRDVTMKFSQNRVKLKALGNVQKEAFQCISPYYVHQKIIDDMTRHIMPLHTVTAGSPMTVNVYRDNLGYYFGRTEDGGIVSLDLRLRGQDRTNSNIVTIGRPGTGKSTALKHIIQTQFMRGEKILIIDPEREFVEMCTELGGTIIRAGGEGSTIINPLTIKIPPADTDDEEAANKQSPLAAHMRTLDIFWDMYLPSLTPLEKSNLNKTMLELYKQFQITWETDITTVSVFPVFSDLYRLLITQGYETVAALLYNAAYGADSFIFNGQTNVDLNNDMICFDTSGLVNSGEVIKRTQYFNVLSLCWEVMSSDKITPVLLVCDEAYLMIDENIPQAMVYLRNISKRCRKVEGAIIIAIHSVVDLLGEKIRLYSQALLDTATYKILFATDGKNLKETAALYDLTENEQEVLLTAQRGTALLMMGSSRLKISFVLPDYKLKLMGTGGGR